MKIATLRPRRVQKRSCRRTGIGPNAPAAAKAKCLALLGVLLTLVTGVVVICLGAKTGNYAVRPVVNPPRVDTVQASPKTLADLLMLSPSELSQLDVGLMNLLCTEGLPGAEGLDVQSCLQTLDRWTERVNSETKRYLYRLRNNPAEFKNSEAYFRVLMLITVLQQDFNVHYNPVRISTPESPEPDSSFFADSKDLFLHGILSSRAMGTCVSMPVFYVAIGRRLGYPMKLVTTRDHLFARWESNDGKERFNIEGTNQGLNTPDDDYYKTWPRVLTEEEIRSNRYLKSLTPPEELAVFLQTRGNCLRVAGQFDRATAAYQYAQALSLRVSDGRVFSRSERTASRRALSHAEMDTMADYANRLNQLNSPNVQAAAQTHPGVFNPTPLSVNQP